MSEGKSNRGAGRVNLGEGGGMIAGGFGATGSLTRILQHDLKSPVSGILSLAQLILLDVGNHPELREYAQAIYDRGQKMLVLMDNLTDLDRIERGTFTLVREPLVLNSLVEQIQKDYERVLKLKGVSLRIRIQGLPWGNAPLLTFWGKENLVWGILDSAFRNALEASSAGSAVELRVDLVNDELLLVLENSGEVPFEVRDRFFEAFVTTKPDGLGLGTFVVSLFAGALEGTVAFKTGEGRTTVTIHLPQREGELQV